MKKIFVPLYALIISCIFLPGCQKDAIENDLQPLIEKSSLEDLKAFYESETVASLKNSNDPGLISRSTDLPEWENALFSGDKNTYIIPVRMSVSTANKNLFVTKYLLISKVNEKYAGYFYYAIGDKLKTNKAISPQEILNSVNPFDDVAPEIKKPGYTLVKAPLHETELFLKNSDKNVKGSGKYITRKRSTGIKQNDMGGEANFAPLSCSQNGGTAVTIDWYYQVYMNGILVYEEYLYSTTECWGTTNTGGGGETVESACRQAAIEFTNIGAATSELISGSAGMEKFNNRVDQYNWKIYTASTWGIVSWDQITWTRTSGSLAWTYASYSHISDSEVGISTGGSRTYKIVETYATSYLSGAKLRIDFTVTHQPLCKGSSIVISAVTIPYNSSIVFRPIGVKATYI